MTTTPEGDATAIEDPAQVLHERNLYRAFYEAFAETDLLSSVVGPTAEEWRAGDEAFAAAETAVLIHRADQEKAVSQ